MVLLVLRVLLRLLLQVTRVVGAIPGMWGMVHGPRQVWNLPKLSHPPQNCTPCYLASTRGVPTPSSPSRTRYNAL